MLKIIRAFIPFFIFGLMCMLGNIIFIIFLVTMLYKTNFIKNISRDIVMVSWRLFLYLIRYFKWIDFEKMNVNKHLESCLIIANHPTLLDVVFLISFIRRSNCIVKKELKNNIFLYPAIKCSHYITNEFDEEFLDKCITVLKNKENLIIFPEGTRTVDKINVHKGVAYIGIHGAEKIIPYYINVSPKCLGKYDKWYNLPNNIHYNIEILKEISIKDFENDKVSSLRVRHLHLHVKEIYEKYNVY